MAYDGTAGGLARRGIRAFECEFSEEVAPQPAPPCEEFNCEKQKDCAVFLRACKAFVEYVNKGKVRKPDFSDPAELPSGAIYYDRLSRPPPPRTHKEKPKFNTTRKSSDGDQ